MSKIRTEDIICPDCGAKGKFTIWDSINVDLNPDLHDKVLSGELFSWKCPRCGKTFDVPFSTLYHDMKRHLMIYFLSQRQEEGLKIKVGLGKDYTYRAVYRVDDLKEKIMQLESSLDDKAIEFMKYILLHNNRTNGIPEDAILRFVDCGNEDGEKIINFLAFSPGQNNPRCFSVPFAVYEDIIANPISKKVFEQDADFPEVSQDFLKMALSEDE